MKLIDADALSKKMKAFFDVKNDVIPPTLAIAILSAIDEARTYSFDDKCRRYCNTGVYIRQAAAALTNADVLHCIGLYEPRKGVYKLNGKRYYKPYRNYFSANTCLSSWDNLIHRGYATMEARQHGVLYRLTRTGLDWLGEVIGVVIRNPEG